MKLNNAKLTVAAPRITSAITAFALLKSRLPLAAENFSGMAEIDHQSVAFRVDIRRYVMSIPQELGSSIWGCRMRSCLALAL